MTNWAIDTFKMLNDLLDGEGVTSENGVTKWFGGVGKVIEVSRTKTFTQMKFMGKIEFDSRWMK